MLKDGKIVSLGDFNNNEERDNIFLIKCKSQLVSIANLKKGILYHDVTLIIKFWRISDNECQ